jgi:hypothetical protein
VQTLVEAVRGLPPGSAAPVNPVATAEADALVRALTDRLRAGDSGQTADVPTWLRGADGVVAIGGQNSVFQLACNVLSALRQTSIDAFTADDVRAALAACCGQSDAYLQEHFQPPANADPPAIVVPKMALLLAVMTHTGIARVRAVHCIGNCPGMLITPSLWA